MTAHPRRRARHIGGLAALVAVAVVSVAGCGGATQDAGDPTTTTTATDGAGLVTGDSSTTTTSGEPVDRGPFCTSIQAIQNLGSRSAGTATPEEVLAQNEQLLDLIDEATATVPDGAPADVERLFDDYRAIAQAISQANGDIDAAYAALQRDEPELTARLVNPTAHLPAFEFFADRCGIPLPQ